MKQAALILSIIAMLLSSSIAQAATGTPSTPPANNQVVSRDAIGLRVVPNPEHLSPLQWYNTNIKTKGSPQSMIVDGYEAVRDGRSVYVSAAKIAKVNRCVGSTIVCTSDRQCPAVIDPGSGSFLPWKLVPSAEAAAGSCQASGTPEMYTNIYIISYNQDPEDATTDIFGQLLQFWKFNPDLKNCSNNPDRYCSDNAECNSGVKNAPGGAAAVCQPTGICSGDDSKDCLLDSDCENGQYCRNKKSAVIRDVKRLADLRTTKERLEAYNNSTPQKRYPSLEQGSYLTGSSISTWPSWQTTLKNALGGSIATDPINVLGPCSGYNATTCWNEGNKTYAASANPLAVPAGSYAYFYQYKPTDNSFRFCGISESGFVQGKAVGSEICQVNNCASCVGRECGGNGCGGSCGTCRSGYTCNASFKCVRGNVITPSGDL